MNAKIERLFRILKILSSRKLTRAKDLARQFRVSERTIYRDIATLVGSGVPIEGEAGVGYLLRGDPDLVRLLAGLPATFASEDNAAAPASRESLPAPSPRTVSSPQPLSRLLALLKLAIAQRRRVRFHHLAATAGAPAARTTARPLCLLYGGQEWILGAWCETTAQFMDYPVQCLTGLELLNPVGALEGPTWQEYLLRRPDAATEPLLAAPASTFDD